MVRLPVGTMFLCLALAMENVLFAEEKEPNSRWSNELFTALDHEITCASLFSSTSPFPHFVQIDCQTSACQKKKKKSCLPIWKINWVISVTGKLPAHVKMGGEGTQILTAID